ncbi:hypothetical protein FOA52_000151 [Chlamydomonas sp. UWO 241]|nr:hypothetical protein FOA52_000151 [Chlamydomonas sp. UWO 241]
MQALASCSGRGVLRERALGRTHGSARVAPRATGPGKDLESVHRELLKEIQARRRSQAQILEKLNLLTHQTEALSTELPVVAVNVAAPAPAHVAREVPRPYVEPEQPQTQPVVYYEERAAPAAPREPAVSEPLAGPNVMKVVMVGSECAPWSKTGGLGDVMGALPKALAKRGHRVMVVVPRYEAYQDVHDTGVRRQFNMRGSSTEIGYFHKYADGVDYVFIDHSSFHRGRDLYGGDRLELSMRCALLSKAALEAVWHVPCGGVAYGDDNCVFIANDWHVAMLPVYLQAHYREYGQMTYSRAVFVIHNIAHQGRGPYDEISNFELSDAYKEKFRLFDPMFGCEHMNILKVGLETAHRIIAVSHGYAWECQTPEGGWGLDDSLKENAWKLRGIVNGIDTQEWSPEIDTYLQTDGYSNYGYSTLAIGKAQCKAALQREFGLPVDPVAPLLGFIGRLDYQKGVDIIRDTYDWLMSQGVQLVFLGSGTAELEGALRDMETRNPRQCKSFVGFSVKVAHRITAGADLLLMPSRFEPCGLNQLYAMAYGTVPIVHGVGGLRDTVEPFKPAENKGTGWVFPRAEPNLLRDAVSNALLTYRQHRDSFRALQQRGMGQDLSWDAAAQLYEEVLVEAKYQW